MGSGETAQAVTTAMACAVAGFAAIQVALATPLRCDQRTFLGLFLALYAATAAGDLFLLTGGYRVAPHLAGAQMPLRALLGPLIYLYVRAMTAPAPRRLSPRDALAVTGPLGVLVAAAPFYRLPATEKLALADPLTRDPGTFALAVWSCAAALALFVLFGFGYLAAAILHLRRHGARVRDHYANVEGRALGWLPVMLLVLGLGFLWHAAGAVWGLSGARPGWAGVAAGAADLAFTVAFASCALRQGQAGVPAATPTSAPYARSALGEDRMARIAAKLDAALAQDRLFENPDLSLRLLAERVGVSEHYLSETLSRYLRTSFFDHVNACRIEAACRRLAGSTETVLAVALAVGFNSRSTFNAAFKKHAGTTPSAYRAEAKRAAAPAAPATA